MGHKFETIEFDYLNREQLHIFNNCSCLLFNGKHSQIYGFITASAKPIS